MADHYEVTEKGEGKALHYEARGEVHMKYVSGVREYGLGK